MSIEEKLDNFKNFVKEISKNQDTIDEYQNMSWFQMKAMSYVFLLPNKDNLEGIAKQMQKKLDFSDEHLPKFIRYLELFTSYLTGSPVVDEKTNLTYEEQLELAIKNML